MILSVALMHGLGMHLGAWMARFGDAAAYLSPAFYTDIARTAERSGKSVGSRIQPAVDAGAYSCRSRPAGGHRPRSIGEPAGRSTIICG
jgi:hypothetical protein